MVSGLTNISWRGRAMNPKTVCSWPGVNPGLTARKTVENAAEREEAFLPGCVAVEEVAQPRTNCLAPASS
jgi:hypothetical protein